MKGKLVPLAEIADKLRRSGPAIALAEMMSLPIEKTDPAFDTLIPLYAKGLNHGEIILALAASELKSPARDFAFLLVGYIAGNTRPTVWMEAPR